MASNSITALSWSADALVDCADVPEPYDDCWDKEAETVLWRGQIQAHVPIRRWYPGPEVRTAREVHAEEGWAQNYGPLHLPNFAGHPITEERQYDHEAANRARFDEINEITHRAVAPMVADTFFRADPLLRYLRRDEPSPSNVERGGVAWWNTPTEASFVYADVIHDAGPALQQVIDAGAEVTLPPGTFRIGAPLRFPTFGANLGYGDGIHDSVLAEPTEESSSIAIPHIIELQSPNEEAPHDLHADAADVRDELLALTNRVEADAIRCIRTGSDPREGPYRTPPRQQAVDPDHRQRGIILPPEQPSVGGREKRDCPSGSVLHRIAARFLQGECEPVQEREPDSGGGCIHFVNRRRLVRSLFGIAD